MEAAPLSSVERRFYEVESLFERRLAFFKQRAIDHYKNNLPVGATKEENEAWEKQRKEDFAHLKQEAQHLENIAAIYDVQEAYRQEVRGNKNETRKESRQRREALQSEAHHPTDTLETNMRACGRPKPSSFHTAHHIVPGTGKLHDVINRLRVQMALLGVGINDGDNGAWMLARKDCKPFHWYEPLANAHKEIHTHNYESWLEHKLKRIKTEKIFREQLRGICFLLETGSQPPECTMPPIADWPE